MKSQARAGQQGSGWARAEPGLDTGPGRLAIWNSRVNGGRELSLTEYTARTKKAEQEYTVLQNSIKGPAASF